MPGDCHYLDGNVNAKRRVEYLRQLLKQIGLEEERVRMFNLSSAMAGGFVAAASEMTEKIVELGANPLQEKRSNRMRSMNPGG